MARTFSTKLNVKVLRALDLFCQKHHLKKASLLEEIIMEGLRQRMKAMELAESIRRGLEQEAEGQMYSAEEVERLVFRKAKAG